MKPVLVSTQPMRLLVVEDEALLRWALVEALTSAGNEVVQAGDAASARRALAAQSEPVDAVLLDLRLPDSSDLTLLSDIRRLSPPSAVVMMTAQITPDVREDARALGVYDILDKPFDLEKLPGILAAARAAAPGARGGAQW